ncbi:hypothetical protein [Pseudarthrobacter sp. NIBRBAC000502770]|nr:hypothetical protein [Pseudarthrobacter sp. NIBRBAC000502770]
MKNNRPEAWHAQVLHDEIEQLTVAVRMVEFAAGRQAAHEGQVAA